MRINLIRIEFELRVNTSLYYKRVIALILRIISAITL